MNQEHSNQGRVPRAIRVPSRGLWALWFVVASLVGLVAMHAYQGRQATELEIRNSTVLEEAGRLGPQISLLKARQIARLEGFLLSEIHPFGGSMSVRLRMRTRFSVGFTILPQIWISKSGSDLPNSVTRLPLGT